MFIEISEFPDIPTLLVIAGILFIFIAIAGGLKKFSISLNSQQSVVLALAGMILLGSGSILSFIGIFPPTNGHDDPVERNDLNDDQTPDLTPAISSTATPPSGTWQKISTFPLKVNSLVVDPTNTNIMYAGTEGGIYKSEDTGLKWRLLTNDMLGDVMALAITNSDPPTIYADARRYIFSSTDGASNWQKLGEPGGSGGFNHHLIIAPTDEKILFNIAIPGGVARSYDGGYNWQSVYKGLPREQYEADVLSMIIDPTDKNIIYTGTGKWVGWGAGYGVYRSENGGETWAPINKGIENYRIIAMALEPSDPKILYASNDKGELFKSIDGGQNWKDITEKLPVQEEPNPKIQEIIVDPARKGTIYLLREQLGVIVSYDAGEKWHLIGRPPVESEYNKFTLAIIFDKHPVLILGVESEGGWRYSSVE